MSLPNLAATAHLIADPARAAMLSVLIGGRALPAGELAYAAGVTAQTASSHLAKMREGGLLTMETEGRHRYYRLAGAHIAQALEQLAAIWPSGPAPRRALSPQMRELRFCRLCYDHLAGQVGVALAQALQERDYLRPAQDKLFEVTRAGDAWFAGIGLDVAAVKPTRRGLARQCLDCSERIHHLAGPLGVQLTARLCESGWLRRVHDSRAVRVTPKGWDELRKHLGIDEAALRAA